MPVPETLRITFLMPLRDDWTSAAELISRLDSALREASVSAQVLLVDDGSRMGAKVPASPRLSP